jgi:hypothetical protein
LSNPFDIPSSLDIPERSPSPTIERVKSSMIAFDELFEEDRIQGKTDGEIKDYIEEKEAQARAQILELIGDLPEVCFIFPIIINRYRRRLGIYSMIIIFAFSFRLI